MAAPLHLQVLLRNRCWILPIRCPNMFPQNGFLDLFRFSGQTYGTPEIFFRPLNLGYLGFWSHFPKNCMSLQIYICSLFGPFWQHNFTLWVLITPSRTFLTYITIYITWPKYWPYLTKSFYQSFESRIFQEIVSKLLLKKTNFLNYIISDHAFDHSFLGPKENKN